MRNFNNQNQSNVGMGSAVAAGSIGAHGALPVFGGIRQSPGFNPVPVSIRFPSPISYPMQSTPATVHPVNEHIVSSHMNY